MWQKMGLIALESERSSLTKVVTYSVDVYTPMFISPIYSICQKNSSACFYLFLTENCGYLVMILAPIEAVPLPF